MDTNISTEKLWKISDYNHVAIMLAPQSMSIERFFDREDKEKQFILKQIQRAENPEKTMQNYRKCLARVNSVDRYRAFEEAGFFTLVRDEERTLEETLEIIEKHFNL